MRFRRTTPPVAAPISGSCLCHGLTGIFFGKRYLNRLEEEIKEYFGVKHVFFISSGKAALYLILMALKSLSSKRNVVIPAYTCFSVASAIVKAGLKISLCDINADTFDFDHDLLTKTINRDTLCVIPNHLFGIPSNMDQIIRLCKDRDITVVEDAAQAMGGKYNGRILGTIGDVGFFSLGRGKNITCGSGGILVTNSNQIAHAVERQYSLLPYANIMETITEFLEVAAMSIFIRPSLYWFPSTLPFLKLGQTVFDKDFHIAKLCGMKAGLLYKWRERLELSNRIRAEMATHYSALLRLKPNSSLPLSYLRLPVIVRSKEIRDSIYSRSRELGLGIGLMYPTAINEIKELRSGFDKKQFPVAENIPQRLLTIPTHHLISKNDKKSICELFGENSTLIERSRDQAA